MFLNGLYNIKLLFFFQVVALLLNQADPNERVDDEVGLAPLHLVAMSNQIEVAKVWQYNILLSIVRT